MSTANHDPIVEPMDARGEYQCFAVFSWVDVDLSPCGLELFGKLVIAGLAAQRDREFGIVLVFVEQVVQCFARRVSIQVVHIRDE